MPSGVSLLNSDCAASHGAMISSLRIAANAEAFQLMLEAVEGDDQEKAKRANAKLMDSQAIVESLQKGRN